MLLFLFVLRIVFSLFSMLAIEQLVRDETLYEEKTKLVREAVSVCYRQYTVNHAYKCRPLYLEYLRMIQHKNGIIIDVPDTIDQPAAQQ